MVRTFILTSCERGIASLALPELAATPGIEIAAVVRSRGELTPKQRRRRRIKTLRKTLAIGPLGAVNGIRMRRWYGADLDQLLRLPSLEEACAERGVPLVSVPSVGHPETVEAVSSLGADLGLSLGNGYIGPRVFTIPRLGMLNIHHEVLPRFRGAQSVIWQIYHGSRETGFTIHRIDRGIDTGAVVYQEIVPITFAPTLGETVTRTLAEVFVRSVKALCRVVAEAETAIPAATIQTGGEHFTTPTFRQFLRMKREHARLARGHGA